MSRIIRILVGILILASVAAAAYGSLPMGISGFLLGALIALLAEPIRHWLFRAEIKLWFGSTIDYRGPTTEHAGTTILGEAIYLRVRATNTSSTMAKRCRAYLVNIEELSARTGQFEQTIHSDTLVLFWSCKRTRDENLAPIDIPFGVNQYIDVLKTQSYGPTNMFIPCLEFTPSRYMDMLSRVGTYRLTIMVTGDEVPPATIKIRFTWTGQWDDFTAATE